MPSLDNYEDLIERLKNDKFDFLVISLAKGKIKNNAEVRLHVPSKKAAQIMLEVLDEVVTYLFQIAENKPKKRKKKK